MAELPTALLMFLAHRYAEMRVMEAAVAAGHDDITLAQARVAARIGPEGSRLTDLAAQAQITKQSAGALVDQLEGNGYVERVPDPADARARLIRFSTKGQAVIRVARSAERAVEAEFLARLGPKRMADLRRCLEDLREVVDPWA